MVPDFEEIFPKKLNHKVRYKVNLVFILVKANFTINVQINLLLLSIFHRASFAYICTTIYLLYSK